MQPEIYQYSKIALKILKNPLCGDRGNFSITSKAKLK